MAANISASQGIGHLRCAINDGAIAQPLIGNFCILIYAIFIINMDGKRFTDTFNTINRDRAFAIRPRARRRLIAGNGIRLAALRRFRMLRVVGVFGFDADFVSFVFG
ncbi:hypothetical protein, partial [Cardiobacterium hominis]|uniref:hypothetical protein n=1 Tax=Cardiobacterium hominis TaxID=2718 RepID=UPI0019554020